MATRKVTITLPEETLDRLRVSAAAAGLPLSTYITHVTEHHARIQDGLSEMQDWEAEHGEITDEERARVAAEIDRAENGTYSVPPETTAS